MAGFVISGNTYTITAQKEKRKTAEGDFTHPDDKGRLAPVAAK
jgi:hypothetical protein